MTNSISILFMDDEPTNTVIINALDRLNDQGFDVDYVSNMSSAIEAYYNKFYDVFVLDIDMAECPDGEEGDGVTVLKRFISLHNQTKVIMFSGKGSVQHWFDSTNAHCFGYVPKQDKRKGPNGKDIDSIDILIETIQSAVDMNKPFSIAGTDTNIPKRALIVSDEDSLLSEVDDIIKQELGGEWNNNLLMTKDLLASTDDLSVYGIIVFLQREFTMRSSTKSLISKVAEHAPIPHAIFACDGKDNYKPSIVFLANCRPFRLIDLQNVQWHNKLKASVRDAVKWYGRREIFEASPDALSRLHITLPDELLSTWHDDYSAEEFDEDYAD